MKRIKSETFKEFREGVNLLIDTMEGISEEEFMRWNGTIDVLWRTLERCISDCRIDLERSKLQKLNEANRRM